MGGAGHLTGPAVSPTWWRTTGEGLELRCLVQPRASRDAILGIHDNRLRISITAPPTDGKANDYLVRFLARTLGVAKNRVHVISGHTGRRKTVRVEGLEALPPALPSA